MGVLEEGKFFIEELVVVVVVVVPVAVAVVGAAGAVVITGMLHFARP